MDPQPIPFPGKSRSMAAAASAAAANPNPKPKPKSISTARAKLSKRSPTNAHGVSAEARSRRAFGTALSTNGAVGKALPPQKTAKPLTQQQKTPPPPPKPARPVVPARGALKPLKKDPSDRAAKAKTTKSQHVSFKGEAAARSAEKSTDAAVEDAGAVTPVGSAKTVEPVEAAAAPVETPFFSAENCSNCKLDDLESAAYWLAQIRLAERAGNHSVAAAFFRLAFECQAQPIYRMQSELRKYAARHESTRAPKSVFDELLQAHGTPVNQPKFDSDGHHEGCFKCDADDDLVNERVDIVTLSATNEEQEKEDMNQQGSSERKQKEDVVLV